jgi:hypothetical protein
MAHWTWLVPVLALGCCGIALAVGVAPWFALVCGTALVGAVFTLIERESPMARWCSRWP